MDACEATKMVMSRIQALDPDNASKVMGYILFQHQGEKEMIRLAFGPENLLVSVINQTKALLGLSSNTSSAPSTPSSPSPFNSAHRPNPFPQSSPRIIIPNNGFHHLNPGSPSSPWSVSGFSGDHRSPSNHHRMLSPRPASYAAVVNNGSPSAANGVVGGGSGSSFSVPFFNGSVNGNDIGDEYSNLQVQDQLSFLDESKNVDFMDPIMSPGGRSDSVLFPYPNSGGGGGSGNWADSANGDVHHHHLHRRSCSMNDAFLGGGGGSDELGGAGFGWRPCMYFARGFCKNGSSCKFVHGGIGDSPDGSPAMVGSPSKIDGFEELLRMKALQQQRFAAMAGAPFPYNRCMNFLNDNQRSAAAALMMGEEFHKFGRCRPERNDFAAMGLGGGANSSSRQIYLTFPADSTFKEEDVSNYFSIFGPVQDVRIPYQQKRMFGFVTFIYPDTVKQILAKGNPHFVCDSRVLVKPYKEKGKVPDKKHQHQMERGDFSACLSPTGLDSADPFDHIPFGARMMYNTQEMMLRRKLEERAEMQQALEIQGRRMMNFQLNDLKNHHHNQLHPNLSGGVQSPTQPHSQLMLLWDGSNEEHSGGNNSDQDAVNSGSDEADQKAKLEVIEVCSSDGINDSNDNGRNGDGEEGCGNAQDADLHESLELHLPDNLFASPTKSAADRRSMFSAASAEGDDSASITTSSANTTNQLLPATSTTLNMASLNSCYFQMPRFSSGQEAIEM